MDHYVMDYETNVNCFLGVFEHYKTDEVHVFTIGPLRNDLTKLLDFFDDNISQNQWHISYNGLAFDSQITEYIIVKRDYLLKLSGDAVGRLIYAKAQDCIKKSNAREFQEWSEKKLSIKQIDIFKLNHWDNPAKSSSLKWIQCSMDWHNVQDMPIEHWEEITTPEQLKQIATYCRNDVSSTKAIMKLSQKQIKLRGKLTEEYKIGLYSASEPRISKELFMHFMSKETGISKYELRGLRTFRNQIRVSEILLPYLEFADIPVFNDLLTKFKELVLDPNNTKGGFKYSVMYKGMKTDFGLGGVHGAKRGIYEPEEWETIMSSDVTSYYPNLAIRNKWAPAHLPSNDFCKLYEWFFDERRKIPKSDPRNYVYKIILNSTYGLSNDKHSFLYDPEFTMRITINGQLSLMMLYTMLAEAIPGCIPIMQNTDGIEMVIPKKYKEKYLQICKTWEDMTQLELEHDEYQKLIVPDVNNYIGVFKFKEVPKEDWLNMQKDNPEYQYKREDGKFYVGKTKCKGRFEFKDRPLHKNKSFAIVPQALFYYFVHGIEPEAYIKTNKNIFDYCGQTKARGVWKFKHTYVDKERNLVIKDLQKTLRYYVSKSGTKIIKNNTLDNRSINVEAGTWLQKVFNQYEEKPFEEYGLDMRFYLEKIKKEIKAMEPDIFANQIKLF
jgi:hypothetical protein